MWEDDKLKEFYPLKNFALPNFSVPDLMFYLICSFVFILLVSYFRKFIFRIDNRKPYQMAPERLNKFDFYWLHTFGNIFMLDIHIFLRIEVMGNENVEILKKALNFVPQKKFNVIFHLLTFPKKLFSVFGKMNHDNFIKSHFTFFVHFIQR